MKAVILAGGLGSRLRPMTEIIPKPLLPLGTKSVLEITIRQLKKYGVKQIILALNYKSILFRSYFGDGDRFGVKIYHSVEKKPLGTAGPLSLIKRRLNTPFLVINGDVITNLDFKDLEKFHRKHKADVTVVTRISTLRLDYGVLRAKGDRVLSIKEKPEISSEVLSGIYFLSPQVLDLIPEGKKHDMPELLQQAIKKDYRVFRYLTDAYWVDIGQMVDYQKAQADIKKGVLSKKR